MSAKAAPTSLKDLHGEEVTVRFTEQAAAQGSLNATVGGTFGGINEGMAMVAKAGRGSGTEVLYVTYNFIPVAAIASMSFIQPKPTDEA